ncbi:MAG: hypothetical protein HN474_11520 [Nitrospina sp.]|nr:hypothetical protein [Nitrospina sp.]
MRFFYWVLFEVFLATSLGFNLNEATAAEKYGYTKMISKGAKSIVKSAPKKTIKILPEEKVDGPSIKVLVIKKTEVKSLVDSIKKNYNSYTGINRYERIDKASSSTNKGRLKIKLTRDIDPTISFTDKPLTLGGKGFSTSVFKSVNQDLHFSFNEHMEESPVYEIDKEDKSGNLGSDLEGSQSKKFLIFHDSGSFFGREPAVFLDPKPKQFVKQQEEAFEKIEPISETRVHFDQNKNVIFHLNPAEKPLDLIRDNSALLRHDYQTLTSDSP